MATPAKSQPQVRPAADTDRATPKGGRQLTVERRILFFDGVCGLCNRFIDFALPRDKHHRLYFAPLQGETAKEHLQPEDVESLKSVVLLDEHGLHRQSTAVIRVLRNLGGIWSVAAAVLWLIPGPLRNLGYRCIAGSRYRLFGKKETCRLPSPAERARFLP